jgi:DNA-directed RNA polymerase subunit RPC12/RpoP
MQLTCHTCGKTFESKTKRKHCPECTNREINCVVCGKKFITTKVDQNRCKDCYHKNIPAPSKAGEVKCAVCGTIFMAKNAEIAKYCPECQKLDHSKKKKAGATTTISDNQKMVQVRCAHCGNIFECTWKEYRRGRKYCNTTCRDGAAKKKYEEKYGPTPVEEKPEQVAELDYEPHPNQKPFHASKARFRVLVCGIRFGKDRASINEAIKLHAAMLSENRPSTLVPRVMGWIVAPTYKLARQSWMELKNFMPPQWVVNKNESERQMTTVFDGLIEIKSADDPDSLVAVGLDWCIITEAGRIKNMEETFAYIRGRLASPYRGLNGQGGMLIANGTPKGRNTFYDMYNWGQDPNMPDWESWHYTSYDNPHIARKEFDDLKKTMTDRMFRQEILAEFLADGGEVFVNVDKLSTGKEEGPVPGRLYKAAWDPAARGNMSSFGIRDQFGRQVYKRNLTGMLWEQQLDIVEVQCKRYNHAPVDIDMTQIGETLPEAARKRGLVANGVYFSGAGQVKIQLVSNLALLMEQEAITLLDDPVQKEQLKAYEYKISQYGNIKYSAPSGKEDDDVSMLMMLYRDFASSSVILPFRGYLGGIKKKVI